MTSFLSNFADRLLDILPQISALQEYDNRTSLLRHLPAGPVGAIKRSTAPTTDLYNIVTSAESWGQLVDSGEWALAIVAKNALRFARETPQGRELQSLLAQLDTTEQKADIQLIKEIVIGQDERLPISFLERGLKVSRSVAKVLIRRVFAGEPDGSFVYGTGWLIAPGLLVTNYHVVAARDEEEPSINKSDLQLQVGQAAVWFDYLERDRPYIEYRCEELVCADSALDYALLRLSNHPTSGDMIPISRWHYLPLLRQTPTLKKGHRLNIIQHPQGGPKRLAIRSNFYVDAISTAALPHRFRYLTDTEPGSSGSPVFSDDWQVVGLHEAAVRVPEAQYKGEVVKYNNQGIFISAIIDSLPHQVFDEIAGTVHSPGEFSLHFLPRSGDLGDQSVN